MTTDGAGYIHLLAARFGRLDATGAPVSGSATGAYVSKAIALKITPNITAGQSIQIKDGESNIALAFRGRDTLNWLDIELDLITPDPELMEILLGGTVLTTTASTASTTLYTSPATYAIGVLAFQTTASLPAGAYTIGSGGGSEVVYVTGSSGTSAPFTATLEYPTTKTHAAGDAVAVAPTTTGYQPVPVGTVQNPNGVSIEGWSRAVIGGNLASVYPLRRLVIPMFLPAPRDAFSLDENAEAVVIKGQGFGNGNFGTGPNKDWPYSASSAWQANRFAITDLPAVRYGYTATP